MKTREKMKIVHISSCDKFLPPYIEFIRKHFDFSEHQFFLTSGMADSLITTSNNVSLANRGLLSRLKHYKNVLIGMHKAEKIILHGLFDIRIIQMLFFTPWLLKKCHWVMWGSDLYVYQFSDRDNTFKRREFFRNFVIKNVGFLITYIPGDAALAREWYKAKGQVLECIMYTSNLYKDHKLDVDTSQSINIQLGNSADPSNEHIDALEKLLKFKNENINIYVPLSYGPAGLSTYTENVIKQGKEWFGKKFKPMLSFMPFDEYLHFLSTVDIAIFNHKRQQAMGNTIALLGLEKTVYIRSETTQWEFFHLKGIKIGDINQLNSLDKIDVKTNSEIIKKYFSEEQYLQQLKNIFTQ